MQRRRPVRDRVGPRYPWLDVDAWAARWEDDRYRVPLYRRALGYAKTGVSYHNELVFREAIRMLLAEADQIARGRELRRRVAVAGSEWVLSPDESEELAAWESRWLALETQVYSPGGPYTPEETLGFILESLVGWLAEWRRQWGDFAGYGRLYELLRKRAERSRRWGV